MANYSISAIVHAGRLCATGCQICILIQRHQWAVEKTLGTCKGRVRCSLIRKIAYIQCIMFEVCMCSDILFAMKLGIHFHMTVTHVHIHVPLVARTHQWAVKTSGGTTPWTVNTDHYVMKQYSLIARNFQFLAHLITDNYHWHSTVCVLTQHFSV